MTSVSTLAHSLAPGYFSVWTGVTRKADWEQGNRIRMSRRVRACQKGRLLMFVVAMHMFYTRVCLSECVYSGYTISRDHLWGIFILMPWERAEGQREASSTSTWSAHKTHTACSCCMKERWCEPVDVSTRTHSVILHHHGHFLRSVFDQATTKPSPWFSESQSLPWPVSKAGSGDLWRPLNLWKVVT